MKRVKTVMIVAVMLFSVCACGTEDIETQSFEAEMEIGTDAELEQILEQELEELAISEENITKEEKLDVISESFECLPDMLDASLEDCLIQIDNTIIRDNHTMALNEVITALQNSGIVYTFEVDDTEYNSDMIVGPNGYVIIEVLKNGERYFSFSVQNMSGEMVTGKSDSIIFDGIVYKSPEFFGNCYFYKGIRADGDGQTYESVKELLAEYNDFIVEKSQNVQAVDGEYYQGIEMKLELNEGNLYINVTIRFKAEDGACIGMYVHTYTFEL